MPNARTLTVLDSGGNSQTISSIDALLDLLGTNADAAWSGSGAASQQALLKAIASSVLSTTPSPIIMSLQPKPIAASASNFTLGTGTAGDVLEGVLIQPTGTTVDIVTIYDGTTLIYTYPGGTVNADLRPIPIPVMGACTTAWKVNFPANATGLAIGKFA